VPQSLVCHKIAIDGGSNDTTLEILKTHGWETIVTNPGIPHQANMALDHVDTELFASFEHDVILHPDWLRIMDNFEDPKVAAVTGFRKYSGSKVYEAISDYHDNAGKKWNHSIDNTGYRTGVIRELGGFPRECPRSADSLLREKIYRAGYKWVVDRRITSLHLRDGFFNTINHDMKHVVAARYLWRGLPEKGYSNPVSLIRILGAPFITGPRIAAHYHQPAVFPAFFFVKYAKAGLFAFNRKKEKHLVYETPETLRLTRHGGYIGKDATLA